VIRIERLLTRHEGKRRRPYKDSVGKLTVGIGRNIDDVPFRDNEILMMFRNDLSEATNQCQRMFSVWNELSDVRQAVLIDMMFNMGPRTLKKFVKMRRAVMRNDFVEASAQMLDSRWATQVGRKPKQRAWRLAKMMLTDEWPSDMS
jgi:lysozyme